ncbi:ORF96 [black bullhead herpesvirus]|uniref:ORF96 n=1 Tax=black bullhead herpesvirus TaxID=508441 RepID=A0A2H5AJG8_9VIRU|nr:ORF96 [black bullhead herpesvirus]AUG72277.1 ORF96 [black bullhead herpesvirus]
MDSATKAAILERYRARLVAQRMDKLVVVSMIPLKYKDPKTGMLFSSMDAAEFAVTIHVNMELRTRGVSEMEMLREQMIEERTRGVCVLFSMPPKYTEYFGGEMYNSKAELFEAIELDVDRKLAGKPSGKTDRGLWLRSWPMPAEKDRVEKLGENPCFYYDLYTEKLFKSEAEFKDHLKWEEANKEEAREQLIHSGMTRYHRLCAARIRVAELQIPRECDTKEESKSTSESTKPTSESEPKASAPESTANAKMSSGEPVAKMPRIDSPATSDGESEPVAETESTGESLSSSTPPPTPEGPRKRRYPTRVRAPPERFVINPSDDDDECSSDGSTVDGDVEESGSDSDSYEESFIDDASESGGDLTDEAETDSSDEDSDADESGGFEGPGESESSEAEELSGSEVEDTCL